MTEAVTAFGRIVGNLLVRGFTMKVKAVIWQEDGVWCGSVPALPGCHTWGESYEHLLAMLEDAVQGWLEVASEDKEIEPEKQLVELSL